jgi:hypothetical protein
VRRTLGTNSTTEKKSSSSNQARVGNQSIKKSPKNRLIKKKIGNKYSFVNFCFFSYF